jgi:colanic acid biosynthesis protein WcaH
MLDNQRFANIVADAPLISIDLVIVRGGQDVLLGLRNNRPAQGFWFVPGGRVMKNETLNSALVRIADKELGLGATIMDASIVPQWHGVFEHFYNDCFAGDLGISTHYVVLEYKLNVDVGFSVLARDDQHAELRWWPIDEAMGSPLVHQFTKDYFLNRDIKL